MKLETVAAVVLLILSLVLAVVSFVVLPDTVVTQVSASGSPTTMPKLAAIAIPLLLGAGASLSALLSKQGELARRKTLIVAVVGVVVFVITLLVNR